MMILYFEFEKTFLLVNLSLIQAGTLLDGSSTTTRAVKSWPFVDLTDQTDQM